VRDRDDVGGSAPIRGRGHAGFAWDEGENDQTLAGWRAAHEWYFASIGQPVDDDTMVVLERFEKLWP
jgi:uncharacterized protein YhfF